MRTEREPDGTLSDYDDIAVDGDRIERLLTELFSVHWAEVTVGPLIEGAAYEIRFPSAPKLTMLDGYLTVDTGPWHFHLCVNDHHGASSPEVARLRRVARAAFFRTVGGTCAPTVWGLRLWNGRGQQMITVLFPSPFYDETDGFRRLPEPDWSKTRLWEETRQRFA